MEAIRSISQDFTGFETIINQCAAHRVVLVGEYHTSPQHLEFKADLARVGIFTDVVLEVEDNFESRLFLGTAYDRKMVEEFIDSQLNGYRVYNNMRAAIDLLMAFQEAGLPITPGATRNYSMMASKGCEEIISLLQDPQARVLGSYGVNHTRRIDTFFADDPYTGDVRGCSLSPLLRQAGVEHLVIAQTAPTYNHYFPDLADELKLDRGMIYDLRDKKNSDLAAHIVDRSDLGITLGDAADFLVVHPYKE